MPKNPPAITIPTKELRRLSKLVAAVARQNGSVSFASDGSSLTLSADDSERRISVNTECGGGSFDFCLPAGLSGKAIAMLRGEESSISFDGTAAKISSERKSFSLLAEIMDDRPHKRPLGEPLEIPGESLIYGLKNCSPACDPDSGRYALGGVCMQSHGGDLFFRATDSCFAIEVTFPLDGDIAKSVIPVKSCNLICRSLDPSMPVSIVADENSIELSQGGVEIQARLLSGMFPKFDSFNRATNGGSAVLDVQKLRELAETAELLSSEENVSSVWIFGGGTVEVRSPETNVGRSENSLFSQIEGEGFKVLLNPTPILKAIEQQPGDQAVVMRWSDTKSAVFIEIDTHHVTFVMPLRRN